MSDLKEVEHRLAQSLSLLPKPFTALVVGGTSGIGAGIAYALSQSESADSKIIIAGRREDAAAQLIQTAKARSKNATPITFKKVDASLMKNIKTFCSELSSELNTSSKSRQIDFLVLSQGILTFTRSDTSEGIETVIALNYYGRMYFIRELIDLGLLSPTCIVVNILNAQAGDPTGKTIDFSDMDMRKTGIMASIKQNLAMTDVMIQDLGVEQKPAGDGARRTYIHDYPGFVKTDLVKSGILKWVFSITEFFRRRSVSIEYAGAVIVRGAIDCWSRTSTDATLKSYWYMDDKGDEIVKEVSPADVRQKVREHTWGLIDEALGGGVKHVLNV